MTTPARQFQAEHSEVEVQLQALQELVDDGECERAMLTTRCSDLERKVSVLSHALERAERERGMPLLTEATSPPHSESAEQASYLLTQVLLDADLEKQELKDQIGRLELDLESAIEGGASGGAGDRDLQTQLSHAETGLTAWSEYAELIEADNERLRDRVNELQEAEALRVAQKGGDTPREDNPIGRPARPGEQGTESDAILRELHAKNVAKEKAQAKVDQLAKKLAAQLEAANAANQALTERVRELEATGERLDGVVLEVEYWVVK